MILRDTDNGFEFITSIKVLNNKVKKYTYKRVIIPLVIMDYWINLYGSVNSIYVLKHQDNQDTFFISPEKLSNMDFSHRNVRKYQDRDVYYFDLNRYSMHHIGVNDVDKINEVTYKIYASGVPSKSNAIVEVSFN